MMQILRKISMLMLLNIQEFLEKANRGEVKLSPKLIEEFKDACESAVTKQFNRESGPSLRMSSIGRPICQQILARQNCSREGSYNDIMRFLFGDVIEAIAMLVMKASGINIVQEQTRCSLELDGETIKGTLDVIIEEDGNSLIFMGDWLRHFTVTRLDENGWWQGKWDDI